MAVKKSGKSSKTAHILNVLSSDLSEVAGEGADGVAGGAAGDFSPVPDDVLATAIRESLVQDIQREEGVWLEEAPDAPEAEEIPTQEEEPLAIEAERTTAPETASLPEESAEDTPKEEEVPSVPPETPEAQPTTQTPPPAPEQPVQEAAAADPCQGRNFCYVNVMEALVEEKAPKYIKMFGVCSCARCVSDVKALALTNLPPKYAVMEKGRVVPMLTVYEGRYSAALTSQIVSACKQVMLAPRH